ncbi:MAG TPA: hypothetical protein VM753_25385, partial [Anaeromyxobacter sp.]|nr:hypothetical protein [Anaeromyxobacter sp.]
MPMPLRVLTALAAALLSVPAQAAAPWDGAPFAAEPAAIRAAAEALSPATGPVDVLLDEATWRLDARGHSLLDLAFAWLLGHQAVSS